MKSAEWFLWGRFSSASPSLFCGLLEWCQGGLSRPFWANRFQKELRRHCQRRAGTEEVGNCQDI